MSYQQACRAAAKWIADARAENARDMDEDVTTWDNTSPEVIMLYLKDMAEDVTTWDNTSPEVIMLYLKDMAEDIGKSVWIQ